MNNNIFESINEKYGCEKIFKVGPFNRFESAYRFEFNLKKNISSYLNKINEILSRIFPSSEKIFYVCFLCDEYENELSESYLEEIEKCNINLSNPVGRYHYFDEDDELHRFILAFQISREEIDTIIKGKLARHLNLHPYYMAEPFIFNKSLTCAVNIYDDRGMDVIVL